MAIIPGIYASQISGHLSTGNFFLISSVTATGSETTLSFSSIPSTYKSLQIRGIAMAVNATYTRNWNMTFNSDTGTNYAYHYLLGNGSTASAGGGATNANTLSGLSVAGSSLANTPAPMIIDIIDYANTNKNKTVKSLTGVNNNGGGAQEVTISSGLWMSTAAITSIQLVINGVYAAGSKFTLYGVS